MWCFMRPEEVAALQAKSASSEAKIGHGSFGIDGSRLDAPALLARDVVGIPVLLGGVVHAGQDGSSVLIFRRARFGAPLLHAHLGVTDRLT